MRKRDENIKKYILYSQYYKKLGHSCEIINSWCHENGSFNIHSFNQHYLSIQQKTGGKPFSGNTRYYIDRFPAIPVTLKVYTGETFFRKHTVLNRPVSSYTRDPQNVSVICPFRFPSLAAMKVWFLGLHY